MPTTHPSRLQVTLAAAALAVGLSSPSRLVAADAVPLSCGPLVASVELPAGWTVVPPASVAAILQADKMTGPAELALQGTGGAWIYGRSLETHRAAFSAAEVAAIPEYFEKEWGLKGPAVRNRVIDLPSGLQAGMITAVGMGSGADFVTSRKVKTTAVFVDVPVVYRQKGVLKSAVVSLFFRGPTATEPDGQKLLFRILDTIRLKPDLALASAAEFNAAVAKGAIGAGVPAASPPAAAGPAPTPDAAASSQAVSAAVEAFFGGLPATEADLRRQVEAGQLLTRLFPANELLRERFTSLQAFGTDLTSTLMLLRSDPEGESLRALQSLHLAALSQLAATPGRRDEYLSYLDRVWPRNPITRPPSGARSGARWRHPRFEMDLVLVPSDGPGSRSFWVSERSVSPYVKANAKAGPPVPIGTPAEAEAFLTPYGLSLPTLLQYQRAFQALPRAWGTLVGAWIRLDAGGAVPTSGASASGAAKEVQAFDPRAKVGKQPVKSYPAGRPAAGVDFFAVIENAE